MAVFDNAAATPTLLGLRDQPNHKVDGDPDFMVDPGGTPMPNPSTGVVPEGWALIPSGIDPGESFRLLFVSSTTRTADSTDINDYNNHVIAAAGSGHSAIRAFRNGFRVLASTSAVHARDNTGTTYTSSNKGVPIYWLGGDKVADQYQDFYDGSWDNKSGKGKNESGGSFSNTAWIWTGSSNDGTKNSRPLGNDPVQVTKLEQTTTLDAGSSSASQPIFSYSLFALSQVLEVRSVRFASVALVSTPPDGEAYRVGDTLALEWTFTEPVVVRGAPELLFQFRSGQVGSASADARYVSGSGTATLRFEYVVQAGDYGQGEDGPVLIGALAGGSPIQPPAARASGRARTTPTPTWSWTKTTPYEFLSAQDRSSTRARWEWRRYPSRRPRRATTPTRRASPSC